MAAGVSRPMRPGWTVSNRWYLWLQRWKF